MSALTDVRLSQNRRRQLDERRVRLLRTRTCQQRLARSRRTVEQDTFRCLDSKLLEEFRMRQRKNDRFLQLLDLLVQTADI